MADMPESAGPPPTPAWIVTFTDLMSLLLTFFILLLTFSTPRVERLFELRGSIRGSFGLFLGRRDDLDATVPPSQIKLGREQQNPFSPHQPPRFIPLEEHEPHRVLMRLKGMEEFEALQYELIDEGYRIRVADALTFAEGEFDMDSVSFARLAKIAKALEHLPEQIVVVAYSGGRERALLRRREIDPMDLAVQRAVRIAARLVEFHDLPARQLAVAGYEADPGDLGPGRAEIILTAKGGFSGVR